MIRSTAVLCAAALLFSGCGEEPASPGGTTSQPATPPAKKAEPSDFARFVKEGEGGRLETNAVTYRGPEGQVVTLVGTVHIADPGYYQKLNEMFRGYDAVLYELVADEEYRPTPGEERGGLISLLQMGMRNALELQFQLDGVDYSPDNFVHADLDPESFSRLQEERGESLLTLMLNAWAHQLKTMGESDAEGADFDLVTAFRNRKGRHTMRMMFAEQLEELENLAAGFGGEKGSVLLEGRNERALEVLGEQLAAGRKKLAIYYGAAHMLHLEKRLVQDMGYAKTGEEWLVAWDVTPREDPVRKRREK